MYISSITLDMGSASEKHRYNVTLYLIICAHTQNYQCSWKLYDHLGVVQIGTVTEDLLCQLRIVCVTKPSIITICIYHASLYLVELLKTITNLVLHILWLEAKLSAYPQLLTGHYSSIQNQTPAVKSTINVIVPNTWASIIKRNPF